MFYGWRIVALAASAQGFAVGTTFFSYGVFVKPLAAEFEAPRLVVVLGLTLLMLVQGLVSPVLGRAMDVWSVRAVMTLGALICSVGFLGLAFSSSLWQIGILFGSLIAVGSHMFGPLATSTLVANWFQEKRGRALGATSVGASIGGLIFPVSATMLLQELGWRGAAAAFAGLLLLFSIPLWRMVVNQPEQMGLRPDGEAPAPVVAAPASSAADPQVVVTEPLVRSVNLWAITAAIGLAFCPTSVMIAHLVPYASDLGFDPRQAAILMSGYAGAGALGRIAIGDLVDRLDKRVAAWLVFAVLTLAWIGVMWARSYPTLFIASAGMGFGVGGIMPLWGALTGACFGRAVFGRAMGLMSPLMLPFNLAGAPIAAYAVDQTGSYSVVLSSFLVTFFLGSLAILLIRIPRVEPGAESRVAAA